MSTHLWGECRASCLWTSEEFRETSAKAVIERGKWEEGLGPWDKVWRQMETELRTETGKRPWLLDHIISIKAKHQVTTGKSQPCLESGAQSQDHPSRIFGFGVGREPGGRTS